MTYALAPVAPVAEELRRIALGRSRRAMASLEAGLGTRATGTDIDLSAEDEWDKAVHETRKHCKEVRAVARLCREPLGKEYARINGAIRDAARLLSAPRDSWKMVETLDGLATSEPDLLTVEVTQAVRQALTDRYLGVRTAADDHGTLEACLVQMASVTAAIEDWPLPPDLVAADLGPAIARVYSRGRKWLDVLDVSDVDPHQTNAAWHDWRKRVKYLWYQLRLVEPAWPEGLSGMIATLDRLADILGEDHDLGVLTEVLRRDVSTGAGGAVAADAAGQVLAAAVSARRQMRTQAIPLACRLYVESPDALALRIVGYLDCASTGMPPSSRP